MNSERTTERWIDDMVGAFADPIIVYPGGWEDTVPKRLKDAVTLERLIANIKQSRGEPITATYAECIIYIYTVCMCQPLDHDWTQIYLFLCSNFLKSQGGEVPKDIEVTELSDWERRQLEDLRQWIYEERLQARKERRRQEGKNQEKQRMEVEKKAAAQVAFF